MTQLIFGEQFEVRDMRHKEKFQIDDAYLNGYAKKCGVYATGVYVSLCRHANKEQNSWPSIRKMSEELNVSPTMIQKGIQKLKKYNIIFIQKMGKGLNNRYFLVDRSKWASVPPCDTVECATTDKSGVPPATSQCATTDIPLRIHSKDTHIRNKVCFQLKDWNERQTSPIIGFKPENIVNKFGAEKIKAKIKEWGQENQGFSRFLADLKDNK